MFFLLSLLPPLPSRPLPRGLGAALSRCPQTGNGPSPPPSPGVPKWQVRKARGAQGGPHTAALEVRTGRGRAACSRPRIPGSLWHWGPQACCLGVPAPGSLCPLAGSPTELLGRLLTWGGAGAGALSALGEASSCSTLALCLKHRLPPFQPLPSPAVAGPARGLLQRIRPVPVLPGRTGTRARAGDRPGCRGWLTPPEQASSSPCC